ncbi:MAG: 2-oxo acid dehydrogenase subunit E2 [Microbacterium sp.]|uniref:dihydrolipoamide acetyltransferase family protein n=1 Tax=Microbacterium sp. TaxID=51671 RepID=UPI001AD216EC|nr:dihydrolipoamide acetyltransferase family protein [Microbacterium sp.]MBN9177322.1 2-oxo acid dehydrogenase subunit E2 [Microbacterium sp.]
MISEFRLPDLGEGLPEAEIVQWLVAEGDAVTLNQPIAEVETAKAIVELPSPFAGTVRRLHAETGAVVEVGSPLIAIEVAGVEALDAASPTTDAATAREEDEPERAVPNLVGYGAAPRTSQRPQRRARTGRVAAASDTSVLEAAPHDDVPEAPPIDARGERPRSTPPVRLLAKQLGIDLALVEASGVEGVIRREDVEHFAAQVRDAAPATVAPVQPSATPTAVDGSSSVTGERETRLPIRGVRKATAAAMVRSAFTAPHVTCFLEVDVTETSRLVEHLRADARLAEHRIGILAVVAKAVCLALRAEPSLNARWDDEAGEIVQYHYVNLGIAAATERGLIVPHIPDAQALGLAGLADAIRGLAQTARAGRAAPSALSGGTFSITNFGTFGVDAGTPILNPPEAGILGIGAVRRRPWEHDGEIALRDVLTLSLSFDHRLVDGEQGARFLAAVGDVLREPGRAMLLA